MIDSYETARPYYQAELAAGLERFFELRRDTCPWCGSTDLSIRLQSPDLIQHKPGKFILEQCATCQHTFQNPRLNPAGLGFYYRDFYDGLGEHQMGRIFKLATMTYRSRAKMLKPYATPSAWLDVGTGHGHFGRVARKIWPATTFDGLDQGAGVEQAQRRGWLCHGYRGEFIQLADTLTGRYDVVSMYHYLEHTREPFDELDTAAKVLVPGGYLLIELPDPESWPGQTYGRLWVGWLQPQHQHMIPLRNLQTALTNRGFALVAVQQDKPQFGLSLIGSLALALNALVPDPRLPWLTARPTRGRQLRHITAWAVSAPLLACMYILISLFYPVLYPLVHRMHRDHDLLGDAYRVVARKNG